MLKQQKFIVGFWQVVEDFAVTYKSDRNRRLKLQRYHSFVMIKVDNLGNNNLR